MLANVDHSGVGRHFMVIIDEICWSQILRREILTEPVWRIDLQLALLWKFLKAFQLLRSIWRTLLFNHLIFWYLFHFLHSFILGSDLSLSCGVFAFPSFQPKRLTKILWLSGLVFLLLIWTELLVFLLLCLIILNRKIAIVKMSRI